MGNIGNWNQYSNKSTPAGKSDLSTEIIQELGVLTESVLSKESKRKLTKKVKRLLVDLAHSEKNKFKAYANGFSSDEVLEIGNNFVNREWMFDFHSYTDVPNENYMPSQFIVACECEWSKNKSKNWKRNFSDIGYDFQKLLFCNSILKVFICRVNNEDELIKLQSYFDKAINHFQQLAKDSQFLFICYCWKTNSMHYQEMQKV